jgi:hypothetical protein
MLYLCSASHGTQHRAICTVARRSQATTCCSAHELEAPIKVRYQSNQWRYGTMAQ